MRNLSTLLITISLVFFSIDIHQNLYAASSTIIGFIVDSKTKEPLPGANVYLEGTSIGAAANRDGKFHIANVPPGKYTLIANYIGYKKQSIEVILIENRTTEIEIELDFAAIELDSTVVVTGQARGQIDAINQQLNSRAIINVLSQEKIREMPDANASESVGRLPGVSVLREGGEGKKLVIRGLDPKYSTISIEGVRVPPTDGYERSTDLSMIGTYTLDGIELMKANTADKDGDAIAGNVDFKIKEAQGENEKVFFDVIAKGTYNKLKTTFNDYNLFGEISQRIIDNQIGFLAQAYYENRSFPSQSMGAGYAALDPDFNKPSPIQTRSLSVSDNLSDVNRYGGTFVFDYTFPDGKIAFKNIITRSETHGVNYNDNLNLFDNQRRYNFGDDTHKLNLITNILNYEQKFSIFSIEASLSHSLTENKSPKNIGFTFLEYGAFNTYTDPYMHPSEIPSYAKTNLSLTRMDECWDNSSQSSGRVFTGKLDLGLDYSLSTQLNGQLKVGGKIRQSKHEHEFEQWGGLLWVAAAANIRQAMIDAYPERLGSYPNGGVQMYYPSFIDASYNTDNFLEGRYDFGQVVDAEFMNGLMDIIRKYPNYVTQDAYYRKGVASATEDFNGTELLSAGYIMTDLKIGSMITFIPGIRFEQLKKTYTGSQGDSRPRNSDLRYQHEIVTESTTDNHWLPMIHLRVMPVEWFDVRFAYTQALARPNFSSLTPYYNISAPNSVSYNNYKLKPERAENFDLYLSFHNNTIGLFTIGGFLKNISDLMYGTKDIILDPAKYNLPANTRGYHISTTLNNQYLTEVKGIEIDWQTNLWYLPGLLKGLVISANFTFTDSKTYYPRTVLHQEMDPITWQWKYEYADTFFTERLINQPTYLLNLTIGYDYDDFSIRVSSQYRSEVFTYFDYYPQMRGLSDDFLQFGLTATQRLPWYGMQLIFDMRNITSASEVYLLSGNQYPTSESFYGMSASLGLRTRL